MQASFQVIRGGLIIFEAFFYDFTPANMGRYSMAAIEKFHLDHPDLALTDHDVVMKWSEWEESGSQE